MRKCSQCDVLKEDEEFVASTGKFVKTCKRCQEVKKRWYENNKDKMRESKKAWREQNRNKVIENHRAWRARNREYLRNRSKVSREQNKDTISEYMRKYFLSPVSYDRFSDKLTVLESPIRGEHGEMRVRCAKCGTYFTPRYQDVRNRVVSLNSDDGAERRLYCSEVCKHSCEVYRKIKDPAERAVRFERDSIWSKEIKKRANYTCERCGSKEKLEAHHEIAVKIDSTKANDLDNGICLCHDCHMKAHSESGCTLVDLRKL